MNKKAALLLFSGLLLGFILATVWHQSEIKRQRKLQQDSADALESKLKEMRAELERINSLLPDQSHAMADVGYHFNNLWFAAQRGNWPLAQFYISEVRSHLLWAVRIKPVRKNIQNQDFKLMDVLDPLIDGPLKQLDQTIGDKNAQAFNKAYDMLLQSCTGCHLASAKPFLHLRIPEQPGTGIMQFEPAMEQPK